MPCEFLSGNNFERHVINFNIAVATVTFTFLQHFSVALLVLITFWVILVVFERFIQMKKFKMADIRWPPFGKKLFNSHVI